MQNIQLTDKQRDKLVIMCKAVYPLREISMFHNGWEYDIDKEYIDMSSKTMNYTVHWLEFCIYELCEDLYYKICETLEDDDESIFEQFTIDGISSSADDVLIQMMYNIKDTNPIDFLWEELYDKYLNK